MYNGQIGIRFCTLHILLALIYNERITPMGLFLFLFGISILFLVFIVGIRDDSYLIKIVSVNYYCQSSNLGTYPLDWAEAFEFSSEVIFRGIVAQSCHKERLECITSDLWVLR